MSDAKEDVRPLSPEEQQLLLEVERRSSIPTAEQSGSGQAVNVTVESLQVNEQPAIPGEVAPESEPTPNTVDSNPSGTKTLEVSPATSPAPDSTKTNSPKEGLPTQVSATTGGPSRDKRYSREETGSVTIHIYKDRSVTVDFHGIVDANIIRGRMLHALLMAYMQHYRPALRKAVEEKRLAAEAANVSISSG